MDHETLLKEYIKLRNQISDKEYQLMMLDEEKDRAHWTGHKAELQYTDEMLGVEKDKIKLEKERRGWKEKLRIMTEKLEQKRKEHETCRATLAAVAAELDTAKASLLPSGLASALESGQQWVAAQWVRLSAEPAFVAARAHATRTWGLAQEQTAVVWAASAPFVHRAQSALASLGLQARLAAAVGQFKRTEAELAHLITSQLQAVPALAPYADPVVVQLLVYAVFGAPLLLLLPLLAGAAGSRRGEGAAGVAGGRGKARGAAAAKAANGVPRGAAAGGAAKRGARAAATGRATRGGVTAYRDGEDVLYTP